MKLLYIHKLVTDAGFIEEFWRRLREADPGTTQEDIFDRMNEEYKNVFGEDRFPSFDAFRKRRDRKMSNSQK